MKFFNWVRHDLARPAHVRAGRCCSSSASWSSFLFGGLTGVILASPPLDFAVSDSYFVVAHFHYVLFGTVVFCMFGGFYFWWPKWTGKMLDNTLGKWHFWTLFIGFNMTFLVQHWLGLMGMPRRVANYPFLPHLATTLNDISIDRLVHPRRVDVHLPLQRLQDLEVRRAGHRRRPVGLRATRWSGRRPARRRGTTSPRSRGSGPSGPRSTCTTRTSGPGRDRELEQSRVGASTSRGSE